MPDELEKTKSDLEKLITEIKPSPQRHTDSPLFQLIQDFKGPEIQHIKTDVFLQRVQESTR